MWVGASSLGGGRTQLCRTSTPAPVLGPPVRSWLGALGGAECSLRRLGPALGRSFDFGPVDLREPVCAGPSLGVVDVVTDEAERDVGAEGLSLLGLEEPGRQPAEPDREQGRAQEVGVGGR